MKLNNTNSQIINKVIRSYRHLTRQLHNPRILALLLLDFLLLPLALITSVLLRLGGKWDSNLNDSLWIFFALPIWTIPIFISLGLYNAVIKYLDEKIILIVLFGVSLSVIILIIINAINHITVFPISSVIIFWVFALAYIGGTRIFLRGISRTFKNQINNKGNVAIYGAGSAGVQLCLSLQEGNEYNVIAFFDDDESIWGSTIRGITVFSPQDIKIILHKFNI